ncbi:ABC transporter ATP-binding protein [Variovorax sp. WS11]|uniref:ABC transporter ATP-binding protein n=1 Tax=Variovorax sp. WS11 TaxID=1105204 RepID=UPI001EF376A8|nr:ABC transporter ATP-binding protein [Variovorax sp. WS11]
MKRFGGFAALSEVSLGVAAGERLGLIGPNGSGKTTLMSCITGTLRNDSGSIRLRDQEICRLPAHRRSYLGIARTFQIPRPFRSMTLLENLVVPLQYVAQRSGKRMAEAEARAHALLGRVGLASKAQTVSGLLTQVELRKMELARAMAAEPKLLISDEAMAGLSGSEVDEIIDLLLALNEGGVTIIMIEHIMQAVMRFSQRVACLAAGQIICQGTPYEVMQDPYVQRAYLGSTS